MPEVARGLTALSLGFVAIEIFALARVGTGVFRFSPIAELDPISAGLIPAVGAIAALSLRPASRHSRLLQRAAVIVLVAAAVVPGSRGPMIALAFGALSLALVQSVRRTAIAAAAVALGLGLGLIVSSHIGSFEYLASVDTTGGAQADDASGREITTLSIRRQWLEDAVRDTPDRPLFGHGVGMRVDNTPEAALMGVSGQRTYPHNTLVEAAYSLGAIGLAAYLLLLGTALVALVSVVPAGGTTRCRLRAPDRCLPFVDRTSAARSARTHCSGRRPPSPSPFMQTGGSRLRRRRSPIVSVDAVRADLTCRMSRAATRECAWSLTQNPGLTAQTELA